MRLSEERRRNQEVSVKQQSMTTPEEINTNGTVKLGCSVSSQNDEVWKSTTTSSDNLSHYVLHSTKKSAII